jgi:serine/threonine protein kinase/tetratricopeptide (TPR) repeat protein
MSTNREDVLFALALEKPAKKREAFLDVVCERDAALRARLEALLAAHEETGSFLKPEGARTGSDSQPTMKLELSDAPDEALGQKIGRYKILEKVGEGGCGVVYVAEQTEPVRRRVALKVIKLGMDTKQVVARFEAERQALAMMDHPNIAKVLDAGATDTGRPYFVMELVRGIKITDYCDQNNLPTKERLDLFIKICQAIQHAHQKGIIHRDIKPSNILVTLHDGVPIPKVIDFGIAKATEGRLTDATVYTQLHQFIGTPAYMSPEQAEMSGLDVDTRSDIYSLGVLLYELLTGRTPFDPNELLSQGLDAMRKTIREKEPVRPSTRLATLKGEELTTTAKRRSLEAPRLIHLLRGDLDWVVMKCLEKDRTRRYETANGLAFDLKRHLSNEAVLARPPSLGYRFQKGFQRHRVVFLAASVVVAALILGVIGATLGLLRAKRAERLALRTRTDAEKLSNFMLEDLYTELQPSGQFGTVARVAKQALDYYDTLPASMRTTETARNRAIAQARLAWISVQEGDFKAAKTLAEEAASLLGRRRQQGDTNEATALALALSLRAQGRYQDVSTNPSGAATMYKRALEVLQPLMLSGQAPSRVQLEYANILNYFSHTQKFEDGAATCNEALSILAGLGALDCRNLDAASSWADTADSQARELFGLGRIDEAEQVERQVLKLAESVVARRPNDLHALLDLYFAPDVLGLIEARRNHDATALDWFEQSRRAALRSLAFNPSDVHSWVDLFCANYGMAAMLWRGGRAGETVELMQNAATNAVVELEGVGIWNSLAVLEAQRGNRSAAEKALFEARKAREGFAKAIGLSLTLQQAWAEAPRDADRQMKLAFGEYAAVLEAARDALQRNGEPGKAEMDPESIAALNQLKRRALSDAACAALNLKRYGEAETFSHTLITLPLLRTESSERMLLPQPDDLGWGRVLLAEAQLGQAHPAEALQTLEPALTLYREMQAQGVTHLSFRQHFARALYVQARAQPVTAEGVAQRRGSLAEAARLLNQLSEEAKQLHDSKELLAWVSAAQKEGKLAESTQP